MTNWPQFFTHSILCCRVADIYLFWFWFLDAPVLLYTALQCGHKDMRTTASFKATNKAEPHLH